MIPTDAKKAYVAHKGGAKTRGIAFLLTETEWWGIWAPFWERKRDWDLCMCRTADSGPYALGNVRIDTRAANNSERSPSSYAKRNYRLTLPSGRSLPDRVARLEVRALARALRITDGNMTQAANVLGITFRQIRHLMQKHSESE